MCLLLGRLKEFWSIRAVEGGSGDRAGIEPVQNLERTGPTVGELGRQVRVINTFHVGVCIRVSWGWCWSKVVLPWRIPVAVL